MHGQIVVKQIESPNNHVCQRAVVKF